MLNLLVETKNEYTTHLSNILTPLIFEGFQTIYKDSMQIAGANDILKLFQSFLKRIPKWNQSMIETETERIINSSHSYGWLNDLIRAINSSLKDITLEIIRRSLLPFLFFKSSAMSAKIKLFEFPQFEQDHFCA